MSDAALTVKICGVRTLAAAQAAVDAGADLLGFNCYPPARRYAPPAHIANILTALASRSRVQTIGVFVNQPVEEINALADACDFDLVQLSGDELVEVQGRINRPVIKAVRPSRPFASLTEANDALSPAFAAWWTAALRSAGREGPAVRALLLESAAGGWGGAGKRMDWRLARSFTAQASRPSLVLAGGLHAENVAEAIVAVQPDGVDVSSGIETGGEQNIGRIAAFIAAAKGARP